MKKRNITDLVPVFLVLILVVCGCLFLQITLPAVCKANASEASATEIQELQEYITQFTISPDNWKVFDDVNMQAVSIPGLQKDSKIVINSDFDEISYQCFDDVVVFVAYDEIPQKSITFRIVPAESEQAYD